MISTEQLLKHFGYTAEWLRLGVVSPSSLQQQYADFESSADKNQEHYRHGAFLEFLERLQSVNDDLLAALLALNDSGPDRVNLKKNRAIDLVLSGVLTDAQLLWLSTSSEHSERQDFKTVVTRQLLWRRMLSEGLTPEVFREVCNLNDHVAVRWLLDHEDLTREHVAWVAEHGCNKPLRNTAQQMLRSRRFRSRQDEPPL